MNGERDHRRWRSELAAFALGALEPDERADLERHLDSCDACRDELLWLAPAVDLLPESVPQLSPPPALRERLLAEVRGEADATAQGAERNLARSEPARRAFSLPGFLLRPATGLAVLALAVAVIAGYALNDGDPSPQTTTVEAKAGSMQATLELSGDSGTLMMTGLRQAPGGHVYQAWVQRGRRISPGPLFDARRNGTASPAFHRDLHGASAVMVTVEPRGGSRQPTGSPIVTLPVEG